MSMMERSGSTATPNIGVSRNVQIGILTTDVFALLFATLIGFVTRFSVGELDTGLTGPIQIVGTIAPLFWIALLVVLGAYEQRVVGLGLTEYGRILKSGLWMIAIVSMVSFLGKFDTSRAYVLLVIPLGTLGLVINRWLWRRWILRKRNRGYDLQSTLVVGSVSDQEHISESLNERKWAGYAVVETFRPLGDSDRDGEGKAQPWINELMTRADESGVLCIALAPSCGLRGGDIRELSWSMEGRGTDLLISSALGAVTGPRLTLRVATGLPFMHLDEVGLGATQRAIKRMGDVAVSATAILFLSPLILGIAIAVLITSGRPVFFRQLRAGRRGEHFRMWKFRTMVPDADSQREALREELESSGPLMKMVDDPRVTPIGRFLRRWSLDELPQLFNVFSGSMSLVGPRPHPLDDVSRYTSFDRRRLLAKPGVTGLWQVAGRSDLSWDDAVELDLVYIENWSPIADAAILLRTIQAVLVRKGAY